MKQITCDELIAFEAEIAAAFNRGEIRAPIHLSGGNENKLISIFEEIKPSDWVISNWRAHYHALLHGIPAEKVRAEIMNGRSITLSWPEHRFLSSAIVGGCLPIAVGIALSIKRNGGSERVHAFVGDMGARTGMFHECLQYAQGNQLPIRFIVEDNAMSVCTPTREVWGEGREDWRVSGFLRYAYKLRWPHSGTGKFVEWT
jgi:TPP-dependent pyruvate/acetoin dehydrogenase alpha subunit